MKTLKLSLLIFSLQVFSVFAEKKKVGCENTPCDQICVDTSSSYYCECYKNWVLQPNGQTCIHERDEAISKTFEGCFNENENDPDFEYKAWARDDATVEECINSCRSRGFKHAGLRKGNECHCAKGPYRPYGYSTECNVPCAGSPGYMCGGAAANSVYSVSRDNRYMGCFNEQPASPDLGFVAWETTTVASVDDCILYCSEKDYLFAGLHNGGRCTCGNSYGSYGLGDPLNCFVTSCLHGWKEQNCGGTTTNAIYRVIKGTYYGSLDLAKKDDKSKYAELPADLLTDFPHIQGMYTRRFAMYASDVVNAPFEDVECYNGNCYDLCRDIVKPDGFDRYREHVVVRKFHINLHELNNEIDTQPDTVHLYAETVVISQDCNFDFALLIRARQIIINYEVNPQIAFNSEGPELIYNISDALVRGPPGDLTFQKQAWLCARLLMARDEDAVGSNLYKRIGWASFDNLARERSFSTEQKTYLDAIRSMKVDYTGVMRDGARFAPFFSKASLGCILLEYADHIDDYDLAYQELLEERDDCIQFRDISRNLLNIWITGMLKQAEIIRDMVTDSMVVSAATYEAFYAEYNTSRQELDEAQRKFEEGIQKEKRLEIARAALCFAWDTYYMVWGRKDANTTSNNTGSQITDTTCCEGSDDDDCDEWVCIEEGVTSNWETAKERVKAANAAMEEMLKMMDAMMAAIDDAETDWTQFDGSIEEVAGLYIALEEWENIRMFGDILLSNPAYNRIENANLYQASYYDTCNRGEALTKSAIEHAENMRRVVAANGIYNGKLEMEARLEEQYAQLNETCIGHEQMVISFVEQNYDIITDANEALITFCQAQFYEKFEDCPSGTLPLFDGNLRDVQQHIYTAYLETNSYERESCGFKDFNVYDYENTTINCTDWKTCPIKMLKENKKFVYEVDINNREFLDVDRFRVEEIQVFFNGIKSDSSDFEKQVVRTTVEVSGPFPNKNDGEIQTFFSRPISALQYAYRLPENEGDIPEITTPVKLYKDRASSGSNIFNMAPYTTWHFQFAMEDTWINVQDVTSVYFVIHGVFPQAYQGNVQMEECGSYLTEKVECG